MLMEWNPKTPSLWDWEAPAFFPATGKQDPHPDWGIHAGAGAGAVYSSSSKSTISASADSFPCAGIRTPGLDFEPAPPPVAPQEPPIGLKLGKRTYFEDVGGGRNPNPNQSSSSASSSPAAAAADELVKRSRVSHRSVQAFHCQVEGCNVDLTGAKDYHRKHRVCESHSKSALVVVAGLERRFCQQCSRFHELSAFDDKKRSCRKRLSDHNARRRKPQPGTISFNSAGLSSPLYDDRQQMNLLLNRSPFGHIRPSAISTWEGLYDFKLAHVKGSWIKSTKGNNEGQLLLPSTDISNAFSTVHRDLERLLPFKGTTAEVLDQGTEASMVASNLNGAPDLRRALSLLSSDSWVSAEPGLTTSLAQSVHTNQTSATEPAINAVNSASHYWQDEQPMAQQAQTLPFAMHSNGSQFQEFQLSKAPYETTLFDSSQIH